MLRPEVLLDLPLSEFGRVAWDSGNFLTIAEHGYGQADWLAASFPGLSGCDRVATSSWVVNLSFGAVVVSGIAGLCSALLFWKWMSVRAVGHRASRVALLAFLLFPYSFVLYGVAYADGLLVCFVLAALLFAERDRFVLAGLAAAAATYTRPNGSALIPALAVFVLERGGALHVADFTRNGLRSCVLVVKDHRIAATWRARTAGLEARHLAWRCRSLVVGVFAVQMGRLHGNPFYFWTVQVDSYGHAPFTDIGTWSKWDFWQNPAKVAFNGLDAVVNQVVATIITAAVLVFTPSWPGGSASATQRSHSRCRDPLGHVDVVPRRWTIPATVSPMFFALWAERLEARPN